MVVQPKLKNPKDAERRATWVDAKKPSTTSIREGNQKKSVRSGKIIKEKQQKIKLGKVTRLHVRD